MKLSFDQLQSYDPQKTVILTTGSQGELRSVLYQMSQNDYKGLKIRKKDTVIISAQPIPGNEVYVNRTVDNLFRKGAEVFYDINENIHISGHAFKKDQKTLINLVKPKYFVPIHGNYRHLLAHKKTALQCKIPATNIFIMENGDILEILENGQKVHIASKMGCGSKLIDGRTFADPNNKVIPQRKELSIHGILSVTCIYNKISSELLALPQTSSYGLVYEEEKNKITELNNFINEIFPKAIQKSSNEKNLEKNLKGTISDYIYQKLYRRPTILVTLQAL
jgi:ribonuclease J